METWVQDALKHANVCSGKCTKWQQVGRYGTISQFQNMPLIIRYSVLGVTDARDDAANFSRRRSFLSFFYIIIIIL